MSALREFLDMGGYGAFVWSAYGIWAAVMVWIAISARARNRDVRRRLTTQLRAQDMEG